jgi:hypothetical protein
MVRRDDERIKLEAREAVREPFPRYLHGLTGTRKASLACYHFTQDWLTTIRAHRDKIETRLVVFIPN